MKYARIEKGIVKEIINFNPKGKFSQNIEEQFIKCNKDTNQGDIIEDGKFMKPTPKIPTQEEINSQIIYELDSTNSQAIEIFEDIVQWAEEKGFILSGQKKELMNIRKGKRKLLK